MFKIALLASAVLVAGSTAAIGSVDSNPAPVPAIAQACHAGEALDAACLRAPDADGNGKASANELANLAAEPTPLAAPDAGLAFQDAAAEPGSVLPASFEHGQSQPVVPALFALGGLVILLRRRPS